MTMQSTAQDPKVSNLASQVALHGFTPHYGELTGRFGASELWRQVVQLGSQPWLDTGDVESVSRLWTREFAALTTNNTLLNQEVQKGTYDKLVADSARQLRHIGVNDPDELVREIAFILNAHHALRLVEQFDAFVSVELHTDLAHDIEATLAYARRYRAICPERFTVKVPLTPAGLVAAGRLSREGVRVNFTLGFSARENVLVCLIAQPAYCNVFLGRNNAVAKDNGLGDGEGVGERAAAASQKLVKRLRRQRLCKTDQIAASLRAGTQVRALAGVDVLTMPPKVAQEFIDLGIDPADLKAGITDNFQPTWAPGVNPQDYAVDTLWDIPDGLEETARQIAEADLTSLTGPDVQERLEAAGFGDILPRWSEQDVQRATDDGKIPKLTAWKDRLADGRIGLDALMTLSGLQSFATDQKAMDDRVRENMG